MGLHREGTVSIALTCIILSLLMLLIFFFLPDWAFYVFSVIALIFLGLIVQFFRNPVRNIKKIDNQLIYAPADGKIVVIEEAVENEYFKDKRLQVSIFMSPLNVHVNRNPISGTVKYYKYHPGKYLVAWHPKSSTENERTTSVLDNGKHEILLRQIAGALARRIVNYLKEGEHVVQGSEMGFIKLGSRVDIFLPLGSEILVRMNQPVQGNLTQIARLPQ